ncbi:hypothetical protein [Methanosarcina mazei]|uniref:Uncharacterized protein n=1 Tax=Methanosarcina mazei TaxID=2209 RepID=A0A0F8KSJ5_METMZ|nr:hypothetical protein [Methanosarcina mazei]KKH15831.1 hypothetical protein DU48_11955 [Methanosarcina mazei]KKH17147.1 hypothetical protein DU65_13025 [Methanosarcina mazei]KKH17348.1 hypothetical protein DU44_12770 [Methanosarcina mazei]
MRINSKKDLMLGLGLCSFAILFIYVFPWIFKYKVDDSSSSYYGAVLGGIIGGLFTYFGVMLSLDNQKDLVKNESESHRNLLLIQLKLSYEMISALHKIENEPKMVDLGFIIFDATWYTHLPYIENLNQEDLEVIVGWFYIIHKLERDSENGHFNSESKNGVPVDWVKKYTGLLNDIKLIIEKIENG